MTLIRLGTLRSMERRCTQVWTSVDKHEHTQGDKLRADETKRSGSRL
jgi:hypothetical protein